MDAVISYDGLRQKGIEFRFRGNVIYSTESNTHFPTLTVGVTLEFATALKTPQNRGDEYNNRKIKNEYYSA